MKIRNKALLNICICVALPINFARGLIKLYLSLSNGGMILLNGGKFIAGLANTDFALVIALNPSNPWYFPYPEFPTPPKGRFGFNA